MSEKDVEAIVNRAMKRWQATPVKVTPEEIEPRLLRIERDIELLRDAIARVSARLSATGMERIG